MAPLIQGYGSSSSSGSSSGDAANLNVTEVDGSPSIVATTLQFPNGTVSDQGGGVARYTPEEAAGIAHEYLGYNTVGASVEAMPKLRHYCKQITLSESGIITSIGAYVASANADYVQGLFAGVYTDAEGVVGDCIASSDYFTYDLLMNTDARWLHKAVGLYLPAGTYWIMVGRIDNNQGGLNISYDAAGADRYFTSSGAWAADGSIYVQTDSERKYSIRACFLPC